VIRSDRLSPVIPLVSFSSHPSQLLMAYVPYSDRRGWQDLLPVPQADALNPLVPINYTQQCTSPSSPHLAPPTRLSSVSHENGTDDVMGIDRQRRDGYLQSSRTTQRKILPHSTSHSSPYPTQSRSLLHLVSSASIHTLPRGGREERELILFGHCVG
jgi:hypothetical protein